MCGIAGFVQPTLAADAARARLDSMLSRLEHRGPDDHGTWLEMPLALGHRRLSIVDLTPTGHQPMRSASGRLVVVYNGEIYNHAELRAELAAERAAFRGQSDTEVLLALVERVGVVKALQKCVGMFAIALWDRAARRLYLARDRFGEKPLYYGRTPDGLVFGSELKALLADDRMDRDVDAQAVHDVLTFGHVRSARCIFDAVRQVEPGCVLEIPIDMGSATPQPHPLDDARSTRYWSAAEAVASGIASPFTGSFDDAVNGLTERLRQSVGLQMQADVPLGAFLSGGVDSSMVVALMHEQATRPVRTYSIGFRHSRLDEAAHARALAQHLGTDHTEWYVEESEALGLVPELADIYDEPLADASQLPTLILARLTRQDVTVALSGDGADEVFGGYPKYGAGKRLLDRRGRRLAGHAAAIAARAIARPLGRALPPSISNKVPWHRLDAVAAVYGAESPAALADALGSLNRKPSLYLSDEVRGSLCAPANPEHDAVPWDGYERMAMLADTLEYLPGDILVKVDRAAMAASLESRAPFLDHRVLEFAARLPLPYLFQADSGKQVLRAALRRLVPGELVDRPKSGFIPPLGNWLRGALKDWAYDTLGTAAAATLIHRERCLRMLDLHCASAFDLSARLWPMLTLAAWARRWRPS